jgi:hypothetical protein
LAGPAQALSKEAQQEFPAEQLLPLELLQAAFALLPVEV